MPDVVEMPCNELVEVVTAYLDGSLPTSDLARLEAHLEICGPCVRYVEQFRETIALIGHVNADDLPPATQTRLLEVFRGWNDD